MVEDKLGFMPDMFNDFKRSAFMEPILDPYLQTIRTGREIASTNVLGSSLPLQDTSILSPF